MTGSYKIKPKQWGSPLDVRYAIFKNAERIGIDPASIALAMPMWDTIDYATLKTGVNINGCTFVRDGVEILKTTDATDVQRYIEVQNTDNKIWPLTAVAVIKPYWQPTGDRYCSIISRGGVFTNNSNFSVGSRVGTNRFYGYYRNGSSLYGAEDVVNSGNTQLPANRIGVVSYVLSKGSQYYFVGATKYSLDVDNFDPGTYGGNVRIGGPGVYVSTDTSYPGVILTCFLFNKILSDAIILYLSDNPYYLLQRQVPVFYSLSWYQPT